MYCEHCGKEISASDRFCVNCGTEQKLDEIVSVELKTLTDVLGALKHLNKKRFLLSALVLFLCVCFFVGIDYSKTFINPEKYLSIQLEGYNGKGYVDYSFDENGELSFKLMGNKANELKKLMAEEDSPELELALYMLGLDYDILDLESLFYASYEGGEVENGSFKNGDTFTITLEVDQEKLKDLGFRTKKSIYTYVYEIGKDTDDLPEPTKINLFDCLDIGIIGADGFGILCNRPVEKLIDYDKPIYDNHSVRIKVDGREGSVWQNEVNFEFLNDSGDNFHSLSLQLYAERYNGFFSGEQVTVSISNAETLERYGIILVEAEKTFKADGLREAEEIDIIEAVKIDFVGSDGFGHVQFVPGIYKLPVKYSANGETELEMELVLNENNGARTDSIAYLSFNVQPTENMESDVSIVLNANPYNELSNGDSVNIFVDTISGYDLDMLCLAGYIPVTEKTKVVSGLLTPVELKLSDIVDYDILWDNGSECELKVGTSKTTVLPENSLGIKKIVTTLGEKYLQWSSYPIKIEIIIEGEDGKTQSYAIGSDIFIKKDNGNKITFSLAEGTYPQLMDYGIMFAEHIEVLKVSPN